MKWYNVIMDVLVTGYFISLVVTANATETNIWRLMADAACVCIALRHYYVRGQESVLTEPKVDA
jgi:hypothetical protein